MRTASEGIWRASPGYHPYYVRGDFNGDGAPDIAVGVTKQSTPREFSAVILDGIGSSKAYVSGAMPLGLGLFFGPPRSAPYRLLVGQFESEGCIFVPKATGSYDVNCSEE